MSSCNRSYYVQLWPLVIMSNCDPELLCPAVTLSYYVQLWPRVIMSSCDPELLCPAVTQSYYVQLWPRVIMSSCEPGLLCPAVTQGYYVQLSPRVIISSCHPELLLYERANLLSGFVKQHSFEWSENCSSWLCSCVGKGLQPIFCAELWTVIIVDKHTTFCRMKYLLLIFESVVKDWRQL